MGRTLTATVLAHHQQRVKGRAQRITIDLDPTDDPTHGQQEFTFFNGHYDTWCYLPLVATLTFNDEAEQYRVAIVLRPGNSPAKRGAVGLLRALLRRLRRAFPGTALRVCVDGGFAGNDWLDFLEHQQVEYVVGLANNARLTQRAGRLLGEAYGLSQFSGRTEHVYGETRYAARSWAHRRRVIIKAEVVRLPGRDPKCNPRFVVTNLSDGPATVYTVYCQRGDMENRRKELHDGLALGRTSCSRFWANQFRVLLTAAAYVLLQELRRHAQGTVCATAQVATLRARLLKLAVWVERSVRRDCLAPAPVRPVGCRVAASGRGGGRHAGLTARPVSYRKAAPHDQPGEVCHESVLRRVFPWSRPLAEWAMGALHPRSASPSAADGASSHPERLSSGFSSSVVNKAR